MSGVHAVRIEAGGAGDLDAVMAVMRDSFDPGFGEAWTAPQCAGILPMAGVWLSLARMGERVVGFTLSRIVLREAELLLIAVGKEYQGLGIGRLLLGNFVEEAKDRGATHLHLEVRDGNPALKLYLDAGFRQIGARKNYYTGADGALFHALTLTKTIES